MRTQFEQYSGFQDPGPKTSDFLPSGGPTPLDNKNQSRMVAKSKNESPVKSVRTILHLTPTHTDAQTPLEFMPMKAVHAHEPLPMSLPPQYQVGRRNKSCVRVRTKMKNASFHKQYTTSAKKLSLFVHSH